MVLATLVVLMLCSVPLAAVKPYESVITTIERGPVPLDRPMITPRDLAQAPQLELVLSMGFE